MTSSGVWHNDDLTVSMSRGSWSYMTVGHGNVTIPLDLAVEYIQLPVEGSSSEKDASMPENPLDRSFSSHCSFVRIGPPYSNN